MRFVIVGLIQGAPYEFHEKLVSEVCSIYKVKRQKLQSHFTIKAPFETDRIEEIERLTQDFCLQNSICQFEIDNYGHFSDKVVYMKIIPDQQMIDTCKSYISCLKYLNWLEWKASEGGRIVFHCTIVSRLPKGKFDDIWEHVSKYPCNFNCKFDNITIMKWDMDHWVIHKSFKLEQHSLF